MWFLRAEQALRDKVDGWRHPGPGVQWVLMLAPPWRPGPAYQPNCQESSQNVCEQDKHTARPGLTQLLLGWAPNPWRNLLSARSPGCLCTGALGSESEVLSSGIPVGGSQTPSSWLPGSVSEFEIPDSECRRRSGEAPLHALWCLLVAAPSGRKGQHPWPPAKLSAQCPPKEAKTK